MKLSYKQRTWIIVAIGLFMIVLGLVQAVFRLKIDPKITNEISFFLMIIAAMLFFSGRNRKGKAEDVKSEDTVKNEESAIEDVTKTEDIAVEVEEEKKDENS